LEQAWNPPGGDGRMTRGFRLALCLVLVLGVILVLAVLAAIGALWHWHVEEMAGIARQSRVVQTVRGPVEYVERGSGPAVLVMHGILGGCDQGLLVCDQLAASGFRVLAVSRPGYLRTPLATGVSPDEQAEAMAALLDALHIPHAGILAWSGAGPAALDLAAEHPDRVTAVVLLSAVTARYHLAGSAHLPIPAHLALTPIGGDFASWLGCRDVRRDPRSALKRTLEAANASPAHDRSQIVDYVLGHPEQLQWFQDLADALAPLGARVEGARNDFAQILRLGPLPFAKVTVPTLIIHGDADKVVPFITAREASRQIRGAEFFPVPGGGHLLQLGPEAPAVRRRIIEFFRRHDGTAGSPPLSSRMSWQFLPGSPCWSRLDRSHATFCRL